MYSFHTARKIDSLQRIEILISLLGRVTKNFVPDTST